MDESLPILLSCAENLIRAGLTSSLSAMTKNSQHSDTYRKYVQRVAMPWMCPGLMLLMMLVVMRCCCASCMPCTTARSKSIARLWPSGRISMQHRSSTMSKISASESGTKSSREEALLKLPIDADAFLSNSVTLDDNNVLPGVGRRLRGAIAFTSC